MRAIAIFLSVIGAVLLRQLADEFKAWIHWLAQRITKRCIHRAVEHMPENERARYTEELQSHIDEMPGEIAKLVTAFGLRSIPQQEEIRKQMEELNKPLTNHALAEARADELIIEELIMEELEIYVKDNSNFPDGTDGAVAEGTETQAVPEWRVKALKRQADLLKEMRECAENCSAIPRLNAASSHQGFLGATA